MRLRIGIFSDDVGSSHAAALVAHGLSGIGRPVTLVAREFRSGGEPRSIPGGRVSAVALPDRVNAFEVQCLIDRPSVRGGDCVVALPLAALREHAILIQFDAVLTVGRDRAVAERALRAARYGTLAAAADVPPAWFLACCDQHDLRTRANLRPERGPGLPFAVRSLPATLPRLAGDRESALLEGRPDMDALQAGILLAVLVVAVAADPHARCVDATTLRRQMAPRERGGEREVGDLLTALAGAYERSGHVGVEGAPSRPASGPMMERRGRAGGRRPSPVVGRLAVDRDVTQADPARRAPKVPN